MAQFREARSKPFFSFKFIFIALDSFRVIRRFAFRSSLIFLASGLGVAGVIASVNFAASGRRAAFQQIARLGVNALTVVPQQDRGAAGRTRTGGIARTLVPADLRGIRQSVPNILRASAVVSAELRIKAGDLSKTTQIVGCEIAYGEIKNWALSAGQWFSDEDDRRLSRVAVIGYGVAHDIFEIPSSALGQRLFIDRKPFRVIGVVAERGQGLDNVSEDDQVYVPLQTAMHRLMNLDYYSGVVLEVDRLDGMDEAAANVEAVLHLRHHRLANLPDDFEVRNQKVLIDTQTQAAKRLNFYARSIGISGLAVSALGILALSWIAVKARTVEIGTRRALGAQREDVFLQIVLEAAILSALGCLFGFIVGWVTSEMIAQRAALDFEFDWSNARMAILIACGINLLFAALPASRATHISPISALRHE